MPKKMRVAKVEGTSCVGRHFRHGRRARPGRTLRKAAIVGFAAPWQEFEGVFHGCTPGLLLSSSNAVSLSELKRMEVGSLAPTVFLELAPFGLVQPPENALLNESKGRSFPPEACLSDAPLSFPTFEPHLGVSRFDNVLC
jgi:hypothetical protein